MQVVDSEPCVEFRVGTSHQQCIVAIFQQSCSMVDDYLDGTIKLALTNWFIYLY